MEAPLPGTDYYEQRTVAKSAWHFDFHANPDIAVYLTHGRERWYITRFFDDLAYQPDAISQVRLLASTVVSLMGLLKNVA